VEEEKKGGREGGYLVFVWLREVGFCPASLLDSTLALFFLLSLILAE